MAQHPDAELPEQRLGDRPHRHPRRRLTCTGPFEHIAGVPEIVLDGARQIGMPGTRTRHRFAFFLTPVNILDRQRFGPVLPVLVPDEDRDRRSDGFRMPDPRDDFDAVRLNLHPPAASIALLPAPKLAVDGLQIDGDARRESGQGRNQAFAVRLSGGLKSKHFAEFLSYQTALWGQARNNPLRACVSPKGGAAWSSSCSFVSC